METPHAPPARRWRGVRCGDGRDAQKEYWSAEQRCRQAIRHRISWFLVELALFGGTLQRGGGGVRVNGGGDGVEVAGANLTLVLDGGEAALLSCLELTVLQVDEGGHAFTGVAVCQVEHAVVE